MNGFIRLFFYILILLLTPLRKASHSKHVMSGTRKVHVNFFSFVVAQVRVEAGDDVAFFLIDLQLTYHHRDGNLHPPLESLRSQEQDWEGSPEARTQTWQLDVAP